MYVLSLIHHIVFFLILFGQNLSPECTLQLSNLYREINYEYFAKVILVSSKERKKEINQLLTILVR